MYFLLFLVSNALNSVQVDSDKTLKEIEELTSIWQTGLLNNHIEATKYTVEETQTLFAFPVCAMTIIGTGTGTKHFNSLFFQTGSQAYEARDFLLEQEGVEAVTIDSVTKYGRYSKKGKEEL